MSKQIVVVMIIVVLTSGWFMYRSTSQTVTNEPGSMQTIPISIAGVSVSAEVAATHAERHRGLSGRPSLADGTGMLFAFNRADVYGFWMKDMLFAIDIIWIDSGGYVVHIEKNITPETFPTSFESPVPSLFVLEVPSGFSDENGLTVGTEVVMDWTDYGS